MPGLLRIILVVFVGSTAAANAALSVFPLAPTSTTPVTLRVPLVCSAATESITRNGFDIQVRLRPGGCPSPPIHYPYEVNLGVLPPGRYNVDLREGIDLLHETISFLVVQDHPQVTVRPFVVPVGAPDFNIQVSWPEHFDLCGNGTCDDWIIEIGGAQLRHSDELPHLSLAFRAPNLAPGLHDMKIITTTSGTHTFPAAVYYHAPGAAPDPAIFERVLFPVLFEGGGQQGSQWRSEAVISNPTPYTIELANAIAGPRLELRERRVLEGEQYPHGIALLVPRAEADNLAFSLRARDVSRESDNFGTEVPVVRESQMFRDSVLTLLDVPLDPRYRTKVRAYAFSDPIFLGLVNNNDVKLTVRRANGETIQQFWTRSPVCEGASCTATPGYLEFDLAPIGAGERGDVYIQFTDGALGWAFASVTNNETQQVTIISPNGRGGQP